VRFRHTHSTQVSTEIKIKSLYTVTYLLKKNKKLCGLVKTEFVCLPLKLKSLGTIFYCASSRIRMSMEDKKRASREDEKPFPAKNLIN
jgi:hypothetical protein